MYTSVSVGGGWGVWLRCLASPDYGFMWHCWNEYVQQLLALTESLSALSIADVSVHTIPFNMPTMFNVRTR